MSKYKLKFFFRICIVNGKIQMEHEKKDEENTKINIEQEEEETNKSVK